MNNNKLIAEFMGVYDEISLDSIAGNIHSWSDAPFFYITEDSKEKVMEGIAKYSKYDTSWDWLMPVVEKILDLSFQDDGDAEDFYNIRDCMPDLNHTYKAVVEFIKTYNSERSKWNEQTRIEEGLDHKG